MKHLAKTTHDFVSDDGKMGIYIEMEEREILRITLAKKGGLKADLTAADLPPLVELVMAANNFVNEPEKAEG